MSSKPLTLRQGLLIGGVAATLLSIPVIVFMPTGWVLHIAVWAIFVGTVAMNVGAFATTGKNWGMVAAASGFMIPCMLAFALLLVEMRRAGDRSEACSRVAVGVARSDAPNYAFQRKPLRGSADPGC